MKNVPITGSDLDHATPTGNHIHLGCIVKNPHDHVRIYWEVDGFSGSTVCEAWTGQHEIEQLERAGYQIKKVGIA
jgi:hypothetical protein